VEGTERHLVAASDGVPDGVMTGVLLDVFEISGRGCVALVDVKQGDCKAGDRLIVGLASYEISGIDIPRYRPETAQRIAEGWRPPLGLLIKGAEKDKLSGFIGQPCSTAVESTK